MFKLYRIFSIKNNIIMVPLVSFLAALRILTEAQICNNGEGKVVFEKVTAAAVPPSLNYLSNASQYEIITRGGNAPPLKVLEECFHRCQEDRLNKIDSCNKFDFLPGKRINAVPGGGIQQPSIVRKRTPKNGADPNGAGVKGRGPFPNEYEPSNCVLYHQPNETINWDEIAPNHGSVWQFNKVCLSAQHINKNCPNRPFVYEKIPGYKLVSDQGTKETGPVSDRIECENRCLMERDFTCRSASFRPADNRCLLSPLNRHVAPTEFRRDPEYEYLENMCLKNEEMCKWSVLIIETGKQLTSGYEKHSTRAGTVNNCSQTCLESLDRYGFVCRSFMFDETAEQCVLYDEDPVDPGTPKPEDGNQTTAMMPEPRLIDSNGNLYRVLCSHHNTPDDKEQDKELDNKTLECYRKKRLRGRHQMEIYAENFYECLTGCLNKYGRACRSVEYSYGQKVCRFSSRTAVAPVTSHHYGDLLVDDDHFDYYQFMWNDELATSNGGGTPSSPEQEYVGVGRQDPGSGNGLAGSAMMDAIEMSFSQPGNYKNFVLPSDRGRDHHRAGFVRPSPAMMATTTVPGSAAGNTGITPTATGMMVTPSNTYGTNYQIEQKEMSDHMVGPDMYGSNGHGNRRPQSPVTLPTGTGTRHPATDDSPEWTTTYNTRTTSYPAHHRISGGGGDSANSGGGAYYDPRSFQTKPADFDTTTGGTSYPGTMHPGSGGLTYPTGISGGSTGTVPGTAGTPSSATTPTMYYPSRPGYDHKYDRSGSVPAAAGTGPYDYRGRGRPTASPGNGAGSSPYDKHDRTAHIQSQIYPVPRKPGIVSSHTGGNDGGKFSTDQQNYPRSHYHHRIEQYTQSPPDVEFKLTPADTGTRSGQPSIGYPSDRRGDSANGMLDGSSYPQYPKLHGRMPAIQYPGGPYGGYSMPRTPVLSNGGGSYSSPNYSSIVTSGSNNNRYMSYGQHSNGQSPYAGVQQTMIQGPSGYPPGGMSTMGASGLPAAGHHQQQYPVPYDRYGQLPPPPSPGATLNGAAGSIMPATTGGCKYGVDNMIAGGGGARFTKIGMGTRLKSKHIYKVARAERLEDCERYCLETRDFVCKSFNFRPFFPDNCELSNMDSRKFKPDDPEHFEHNTQFDYYEKAATGSRGFGGAAGGNGMDCFEVTQTCSPEGMELKLKTPDGFYGRIYTYGFYDSCFFDGNGGTTSVLKISKPNGFPRCGTQQIGDAMTNIVVVQFNDYVQTSRDKKYNLTCYLSGPGEAVVTSNYLDTKTDGRHPMQIEHLPAQNILTSNIVLRILYRGTPTNTIVVGDLLTFRLEARNQYRFNGYYNDIFATNVIAKDPYTGRQVLLIDSRGCPVDLYVFPELHKTADGALEAEFYAFKIPDSNFLVFQATVKTCKGPCEPVICTDRGVSGGSGSGVKTAQQGSSQGSFPSWGRRKRSPLNKFNSTVSTKPPEPLEEVHELLRVYLSPEDVPESQMLQRPPEPPATSSSASELASVTAIGNKVCIDRAAYHSLIIVALLFFLLFLIAMPYLALVRWIRWRFRDEKNSNNADHNDQHHRYYLSSKWPRMASFMLRGRAGYQHHHHSQQPAPIYGVRSRTTTTNLEPIYHEANPHATSGMERSRSMQSITISPSDNINRIVVS